jgi:hypothetical protein
MVFQFYSNAISKASRSFSGWMFVLGLILIGIGVLIYILRDLFAILFMALFFVFGLGCIGMAVRIFVSTLKMQKMQNQKEDDGRENVRVRIS